MPAPVFVMDPAAHVMQSLCWVCPFILWYVPASQLVQAATLDAVENVPAVQAVHVVAPVPAPVFVMDPAAHVMQSLCWVCPFILWYVPASQLVQAATLDAVENVPAVQAVHVVAPVLVPVFVIDPALQSVHVPPKL